MPAHAASLFIACEHLTYAEHLGEACLAPDYPMLDSVTFQKLSGSGVMMAFGDGILYACNAWIGMA